MESRRVDNQARGRAGRQGDEGNSIFYVSLEDDLMRIFGTESLNSMLEKLGLKDGESINHPWINKALERAQQKVESRNFDIRKTLLKFDNVLNDQRHVIFTQRNNIISNEFSNFLDGFIGEVTEELLQDRKKYLINPKENFYLGKLKSIFGKSLDEKIINETNGMKSDEFVKFVYDKFNDIRNNRIKILGEEQNYELEKRIFLQIIDQNWKNHIQYLEQLRQVVGLRSYGNRDPLIEYKKEAFSLFENLLSKLKIDLITILANLTVVSQRDEIKKNDNQEKKIKTKVDGKKIGRNDPCFCGSGKKFKHCCGSL